jgi:hypothetical protein
MAVEKQKRGNTFLLRDDLPWQGCRHLFFPIGTKTKEKKKRKEPKEKKELLFYIYIKRYLKDYYIYI